MDNDIIHASGNYQEYNIEYRITFALVHARLYSAESDDERDNKSAAEKKFDRSCGDGGYSSSLSSIFVSVSDTSDVVRCWILTSDIFITNYPLPSDDLVDWNNDSMLGIGGVYTIIDEGLFVLHS